MSNDEQAWYAAAVEPEATARLRVGTAVPDGVPMEARQQSVPAMEREWVAPEPFQRAEAVTPLQPFERAEAATPVEPFERAQMATPVEPFERAQPAMPVQPFERADAATPVEPFERAQPATPVEPLQRADAAMPVEPLQRMSAGVPAEEAVARRAMSAPTARTAAKSAGGDGGSGSAGQGFQVDPGQYQAAVSPMLAVSEQVGSLYSALSSFLPSLEAQNPWGNDESGKKFAEGEKGYLKYSKDTLDVIKGLPAALKGIADGLKAMADGYQNADEGVISELNGVDPGSAPMPVSPQLPNAVHLPITPRITQSGRH
ncbi:hypothetical protein [Kitasatospora cheerisanensis]|uniref:Uncharacterized protein n=1 Tax=Kitasatospora cheerisanensis KCTC 2395 TaxID=1348663 RepID=A0A066YQ45_9ACTN|nr:hypothetical protein [Kitasatospora cheerisanensis]KDN82109.1 hypothetical protein KCH_61250 [Kitasatospora cheerisanensis KCTC 2395]